MRDNALCLPGIEPGSLTVAGKRLSILDDRPGARIVDKLDACNM